MLFFIVQCIFLSLFIIVRSIEGPRLTSCLPISRAGVLEGDQDPTVRSLKKKKPSGSHLWRMSNPSPKSPQLDRTSGLQKSHSALNLASDRKSLHPSIHPIHLQKFCAPQVTGVCWSVPAVIGWRQGGTLDRSPLHRDNKKSRTIFGGSWRSLKPA